MPLHTVTSARLKQILTPNLTQSLPSPAGRPAAHSYQFLDFMVFQSYCANWGYVVFTDDSYAVDENPWDELPSYFTALLEAVEKAPGSAAECGTLAPTAAPMAAPTSAPAAPSPEPTPAPASIFAPPEATPEPTPESTDAPGPVQVDLVPCILAAQDIVSTRRAFGENWS